MRALPSSLLFASLLTACVAEPAPPPCERDHDCPRDAPWCVLGTCDVEPYVRPGGDAAPPVDPCAEGRPIACAEDCAWFVGCVERECPRAVADNPELVQGIGETCLAQCAVDPYVAGELCRLSADDACVEVVDQSRVLLGFSICR